MSRFFVQHPDSIKHPSDKWATIDYIEFLDDNETQIYHLLSGKTEKYSDFPYRENNSKLITLALFNKKWLEITMNELESNSLVISNDFNIQCRSNGDIFFIDNKTSKPSSCSLSIETIHSMIRNDILKIKPPKQVIKPITYPVTLYINPLNYQEVFPSCNPNHPSYSNFIKVTLCNNTNPTSAIKD
jgi:hypothetical protein